jgi:hypothetical protein
MQIADQNNGSRQAKHSHKLWNILPIPSHDALSAADHAHVVFHQKL